MSRSMDEWELEEGARKGDHDAIRILTDYLTSPQPFTRARSSELLAQLPEEDFSAWAQAFLASEERPSVGWRVFAVRAVASGQLPKVDGLSEALAEHVTAETDADEAVELVGLVEFLPSDESDHLLFRLTEHPDPEVRVEAVWVLAERGHVLSAAVIERLKEVPPERPEGDMAAVLLASAGVPEALSRLPGLVLEEHFLASKVLEVLEANGDRSHGEALRPCWDKWVAGRLAPRAAAVSAALEVPGARERLEKLAEAWRGNIRRQARAELLRMSSPDNILEWARNSQAHGLDQVSVTCTALLRRGDTVARDALRLVAERDTRTDARLAAIEMLLDGRFGHDEIAWCRALTSVAGVDPEFASEVHEALRDSERMVASLPPGLPVGDDTAPPPLEH